MRKTRMIVALMVAVSGLAANAASTYKQSLTHKKEAYVLDGVFTGGQAGNGAAILGVRRTHSKKARLERIVVDLGQAEAGDTGRMPYFQASVDRANKQIVLDLVQLRLSKVSETSLKTLFKKSPYVADVSLTLDPEDKGGTMVLKLKQRVRLEVFQMLDKKKPARVVMDLRAY